MRMKASTTVIIGLCGLGVFLFASNLVVPPETDEFSKALKVMYMAANGTYFRPLDGPTYYNEYYFTFYYICSSLIYGVLGGDVFLSMTLQSVFLGVVFLVAASYILQRAYRVSPYYAVLVFLSMPLVVTTFAYGNEVAYSATFFVLSLCVTLTSLRFKYILAVLLYCAAIFSRLDMVLLAPFWAVWIAFYSQESCNREQVLKLTARLAAYLVAFSSVYWYAFLRQLPPSYPFLWDTNVMLLMAYLVYSFCPPIFVMGLMGGIWYGFKTDKKLLVNFLMLPFLLFYIPLLSSPKYVMVLSLLFGIPAAILLARARPWQKVALIGSILIFWAVSLSPYGVRVSDGYHFVVPTGDAPIPTGAYFLSYAKMREGFYQQKFFDELESAKAIVEYMKKEGGDYIVVPFNMQIFSFYIKAHGHEKMLDTRAKRFDEKALSGSERIIFLRRRYLKEIPQRFEDYLRNGQVKWPVGTVELLPPFIEVGPSVKEGTDERLSKRILFFREYYGGFGAIHREIFSDLYKSTCWERRDEFDEISTVASPIFADDDFSAFSFPCRWCLCYGSEFPFSYYSQKMPIRYALDALVIRVRGTGTASSEKLPL